MERLEGEASFLTKGEKKEHFLLIQKNKHLQASTSTQINKDGYAYMYGNIKVHE